MNTMKNLRLLRRVEKKTVLTRSRTTGDSTWSDSSSGNEDDKVTNLYSPQRRVGRKDHHHHYFADDTSISGMVSVLSTASTVKAGCNNNNMRLRSVPANKIIPTFEEEQPQQSKALIVPVRKSRLVRLWSLPKKLNFNKRPQRAPTPPPPKKHNCCDVPRKPQSERQQRPKQKHSNPKREMSLPMKRYLAHYPPAPPRTTTAVLQFCPRSERFAEC